MLAEVARLGENPIVFLGEGEAPHGTDGVRTTEGIHIFALVTIYIPPPDSAHAQNHVKLLPRPFQASRSRQS